MQLFVIFRSPLKTNFAIVPQLGHDHFLPNPFKFITHVILLPDTECSRCRKCRETNHENIIIYLFPKFKLRAIIWILTATYFFCCPLHLLRFLYSICLFLYPLSPRYPKWGVLCNRNFLTCSFVFLSYFLFRFSMLPSPTKSLSLFFCSLSLSGIG